MPPSPFLAHSKLCMGGGQEFACVGIIRAKIGGPGKEGSTGTYIERRGYRASNGLSGRYPTVR